MKRMLLSGNEWRLTAWGRNHWRPYMSMELGAAFKPMLPTIQASVPGSVQTDLMRAGMLADPNEGLRSLEQEWVNHRDWMFERTFTVPEDWAADRVELVFEGLDFAGHIFLNGEELTAFEGMFLPVVLDVTSRLKMGPGAENRLQVLFVPGPEVDGQIGFSNEISTVKSRFNYGWDWCPRIVPVGIWKDVTLHARTALKIGDFAPLATVADDGTDAAVAFRTEADIWRPGTYTCTYRVLAENDGRELLRETRTVELAGGTRRLEHAFAIAGTELWWPNGCGAQPTYHAFVEISDAHGEAVASERKRIAFRTLAFVQNEDSPADALPYTLLVNGRRVFLKGVNWVPVTPFLGDVKAFDYELQLGRFKAMNANLIRVWGGAITEKQAFYDYCDLNGLLVWQEFLQSSSGLNNCPPDNAAFLAQLERISRAAVIEKRSHPCLTAWCGGNELMWEGFRPVDERHANIAMLKRVVSELDPGRAFFPASASGPRFGAVEEDFGRGLHHDVHGPWNYVGEEHHYRYFNGHDALLLTEVGTPGASRVELLRKWADRFSPWPPTASNAYWLHRGAWWLQWEQLEGLFGEWDEAKDELEIYVQASRYLQAESLRYMAESTRRREPQASGFIVWMGNEPYANNANTSLLEHDGMPKPAYYAIQRAFGAIHVSARYARLGYAAGDRFAARVYLHCEAAEAYVHCEMAEALASEDGSLNVSAELLRLDGSLIVREQFRAGGDGGELGELAWEVEDEVPGNAIVLRLEARDAAGQIVAGNEYIFSANGGKPLEPLRRLPAAEVRLEAGEAANEVVAVNRSATAAIGVFLIQREAGRGIRLSRNYFTLLPGERVAVASDVGTIAPEDFYVEGFNLV